MTITVRDAKAGDRFHGLEILVEIAGRDKTGLQMSLCLCDCGNEKLIRTSDIVRGKTKSCGCLHKVAKTKHGMSGTRPYRIWVGMLFRVTDTDPIKRISYLDKGITVCPEWKSFDKFWEDMGDSYFDGASIDRRNPNKGYYKENCRWATSVKQSRNKTLMSNNVTGVNGVCYNKNDHSYSGNIHDQFGDQISRSFSINKYGEEEALRMATQWRKDRESELLGTEYEYSEFHGNAKGQNDTNSI